MSAAKPRRDLAVHLIIAISQIKNLQDENAELRRQLYIDALTNIANRRAFDEELPKLVKTAQANNEPFGLLIADVDGLKRTNDQLGHEAGDKLLVATADALKQVARDTDLVGRLGGDEYFALLPGFSPLPGQKLEDLTADATNRYQKSFQAVIGKLDLPAELHVGVSFGIGILGPNEPAADFYARVDAIAQASKKAAYDKRRASGISFKDDRL